MLMSTGYLVFGKVQGQPDIHSVEKVTRNSDCAEGIL